MTVEMVVEQQKLGVNVVMKVGDRVRVKESVVVYHHPEHRGQAFDIKGIEGEVIGIATEWQGRPVSANLPILVKFSQKFKAHLRDNELELI
ncbi:ferredoxin-thioredoxin reductase variable chain [Umezakia ovalisporum]|uniref:Ferredoxin-thioredoxin reductase variable chain n=2 Tax=Umezakia ovalisporum TaxID=75695 RepID=A0AA43H077_9CYAN|nr:ferredoxin-thioredoxin reductase variable chain [Umezakia ovalisporum]MBI1241198.1 ferredoxin--nitrite reductase [Nostoc sp. RI_552]MDH6057733.1 ferredoxin-thioredoxin reductase variable chain [Umezakia ovalisporum FSS-43]MDH6064765.1 ferredoxin-thioredoxin reductase variable chain [Umezakia ovalisporum FSS-62]MDH6067365.1 ferredoxin-thioredoxin reductase variable chain [Umezakia ovalisporum APH033B]MDH6070320.1 ferredoxin-thioredoxin reductase variable chain [Umezakia ovalisporum CobakiLak